MKYECFVLQSIKNLALKNMEINEYENSKWI